MQITLIDTFIVSEGSKPALLEASRTIQGILKTLPGFVEGFVYEKRSGGGPYNIVTTAVWESEEAYAAAKTATATRFQAIGLNPPEIMRALDVQVDRGVYVRTPY
jgi:heme-degrading monooxygenase HmoA